MHSFFDRCCSDPVRQNYDGSWRRFAVTARTAYLIVKLSPIASIGAPRPARSFVELRRFESAVAAEGRHLLEPLLLGGALVPVKPPPPRLAEGGLHRVFCIGEESFVARHRIRRTVGKRCVGQDPSIDLGERLCQSSRWLRHIPVCSLILRLSK
jgi:hypothetical protein